MVAVERIGNCFISIGQAKIARLAEHLDRL
jgi:hypothetical protein